jgi:hypothetical protein
LKGFIPDDPGGLKTVGIGPSARAKIGYATGVDALNRTGHSLKPGSYQAG